MVLAAIPDLFSWLKFRSEAMFTIKCNFLAIFKIGDNINHNLIILKLLYDFYKKGNDIQKNLLCKPIIILLVSIIEAILYDFHVRIVNNTREGVKNLAESVINYIRGKQLEDLEKYISSAKKHDLFDVNDTIFYERMDNLRKLRNRIHIQNKKGDFEPDELQAFNEKRKILAEKVLEKTLKTMAAKYPRNFEVARYVDDFQLPWGEYFS